MSTIIANPVVIQRDFSKYRRASVEESPHILYCFRKETVRVKKDTQEITVYCFFTEEGETLPELIAGCLRLFTTKNLQDMATKHCNISDEWPLISRGKLCTWK